MFHTPFGSDDSLDQRNHSLIYHVSECFGDVGACEHFDLLDLHAMKMSLVLYSV
jgi:hypothetical protein